LWIIGANTRAAGGSPAWPAMLHNSKIGTKGRHPAAAWHSGTLTAVGFCR
jgi:hypothetical protein